ncbi:protein translocase subunit SecF [Tessaracoccus sp. Y1736]
MSTRKLGIAERLYTGQTSYDFIKHRRLWFIVSAVIIGVSLLLLVLRGLTLGIEFSGGTDFQAPMSIQQGTVDEVRAQMADVAVKDLAPQVFALGEDAIRVQTRALSPDETNVVRAEVARIAGSPVNDVTYNAISGSWGEQITRQGTIALVVFIVLVMALIAVYFRDWKMSVAAVVAVFHDLLVTVGVYAAVGFTVTPSTVIGVLTILAYSLYDTVVVFDKIRENVKGIEHTSHTYSEQANLAVNQVLVRSLNTTVIGVLPVLALFIAGATLQSGPLADLGLALLIGMIAGAYSSLFIAMPVLAWLREREPVMVEHREQLARRKARAAQRAGAHKQQLDAAAEPMALVDGEAFLAAGVRQQRRTGGSRAERKGKR